MAFALIMIIFQSYSKLILKILILLMPFICQAQNQVSFRDIATEAGITTLGHNYGVSFGDFDNDGDDDLYVCTRQEEANLFYENKGDGRFEEAAEKYGIHYTGSSNGSLWIDIDNDGFLDLFIGNDKSDNLLFKNKSGNSFTDITLEAGLKKTTSPLSINAADVDNDGYIDLYLSNPSRENTLYRNNGNGTFTDITMASGATDDQIAMGSIFFDYDNDNDQDLYLTHDALQANILYENDGNGAFTEVSSIAGADYKGYGMGVEVADLNADGFPDIYVTNLYDNILLSNNGDNTFTEIGKAAGVNDYGMGWGVTCLDFDNDGMQDIYVVNNGIFSPHLNLLYKNTGNNTFKNVSENTELESMYAGFGAACSDIDNDGDLDIFLANSGAEGKNQLFLNESETGNWIKIKTEGIIANKMGVGTRVFLEYDDRTSMDEVNAGMGYLSQNSYTLHFGLGNNIKVDKLTINWPSGKTDTYYDVEANQYYYAVENQGLKIFNNMVITGVEDNEVIGASFKVYPVPSESELNIVFENHKKQNLEIYLTDVSGKRIRTISNKTYETGKQGLSIQHEGLWPDGLYILHIKGEYSSYSSKVILGTGN